MTITKWLLPVVGVCVLGGCGASDAAPAEDTATSASALAADRCDGNPNPALFARDARPYGRSMELWTEQWWRWAYSIPPAQNPLLNPTLDSNQQQSGPVYFLAPGDRNNTVPHHRAIAVVTSSLSTTYPCPDPTFHPAPGQSLFDFLLPGVAQKVVSVEATLDGQVLTDLMSYHAASDDLAYLVGDTTLQATFDPCITGQRQPFVADAFIFVIKPLDRGPHELTTRVVNTAGQVFPHVQRLDVQ